MFEANKLKYVDIVSGFGDWLKSQEDFTGKGATLYLQLLYNSNVHNKKKVDHAVNMIHLTK